MDIVYVIIGIVLLALETVKLQIETLSNIMKLNILHLSGFFFLQIFKFCQNVIHSLCLTNRIKMFNMCTIKK